MALCSSILNWFFNMKLKTWPLDPGAQAISAEPQSSLKFNRLEQIQIITLLVLKSKNIMLVP